MLLARLRLAALWCSQVARIAADNALRVAVVLTAARVSAERGESAWELAAALFVLPALVLAPCNGAISNSLPKRRVLIGAAAYCLAVVTIAAWLNAGWLAAFGLVAIGNALYSPARYGLLPAAAHDAHVPLTRVNGWIEMGAVSAIIGGLVLGLRLFEQDETTTAALAIVGLNVAGLAFAVPARFPSDIFRPEPAWPAVRGFFTDFRRILRQPETRSCLFALAAFRGLTLAVTGPLIAVFLSRGAPDEAATTLHELIPVTLLILAGAAAGAVLAGVQGHPTRALGLVPLGATGFALLLAVAAMLHSVPGWLCVAIGLMSGLINVPLMATYQAGLPADARGNGMAALNMAGYACMSFLALSLAGLARGQILSPGGRLWLLVALTGVGAAVAWWALLRDLYDQILEWIAWPFFRIRGHGPGLDQIPPTGPLLVIANHTAWFDPVWLGKVLPRRLTGMLTSVFFDLPVLHFLATKVVHAIRVEQSRYRREAPELAEAIAALDRGEAVLLFPEGQMRKKEEKPLHPFGRGVWHILHERPQTPVVVCWIEGAWGSFTSYKNGPPTKNKRFDRWRGIDVAVGEPEVLDAALLEDHRATRNYLMRKVSEARHYLGLEPLRPPEVVHSDKSSDA